MFKSLSSNLKLSFHTENNHKKATYAIRGEDRVVQTFFSRNPNGFYLDIGSHHPFRFSNTYLLYKQGWHGINIDANQNSITLLNKYRPKDLNLQHAVSDVQEERTFHITALGAMNTLDDSFVKKRKSVYLNKEIVQTETIAKILEANAEAISNIDFLNIDLEGFDLRVLKSFPFGLYRPTLICIEDHNFNFLNPMESEIVSHLTNLNYVIHAFVPNTLIFRINSD